MPTVDLDGVTLSYDVRGDGEPIVLLAGCGAPAVAWEFTLTPALVAAGYQVISFDNRGMAPSSSPPAPYAIADMAGDTLALLDHLSHAEPVWLAGHSMGGWIAETLALEHPERVRAAALMGSCNVSTAWEKAVLAVDCELAERDVELPRGYGALEVLRYLPTHELQQEDIVVGWLELLGAEEPWPNPGRLGQYQAARAWVNDARRTEGWSSMRVPCLVLSFEYDTDSPPARAKEAADRIPGARFVEIPGAGHLGVMTHVDQVAEVLSGFFGRP